MFCNPWPLVTPKMWMSLGSDKGVCVATCMGISPNGPQKRWEHGSGGQDRSTDGVSTALICACLLIWPDESPPITLTIHMINSLIQLKVNGFDSFTMQTSAKSSPVTEMWMLCLPRQKTTLYNLLCFVPLPRVFNLMFKQFMQLVAVLEFDWSSGEHHCLYHSASLCLF